MKFDTTSPVYVIGYSAVVSAVFTGAIMALQAAARPLVERNEKMFRYKALAEVLELGDVEALSDDEIVKLVEDRVAGVLPGDRRAITDPRTGRQFPLYEGRDEAGRRVGWAFPVSGIGFWDRITGLMAVTPDLGRIMGVRFLTHVETPGLGGRISTDRRWLAKFRGLKATLPERGGRILYIGGDRPAQGDPRHGRWVDALSGATGTSTAVGRFLNEDLAAFRRAAEAAGL